MPAPAVIVNVFGKVDGFLTGWGPTRNPEGPDFFVQAERGRFFDGDAILNSPLSSFGALRL